MRYTARTQCCYAEIFAHIRIMGALECGHCGREVDSEGEVVTADEYEDDDQ